MSREYFIKNMKGILHYQNMPLLDFEIKNRELVKGVDLSGQRYWPPEIKVWGLSYVHLNDFFSRRVVPDNQMLLHDYLQAMNLESYNFEEMIKRRNGANGVDDYWVKFDGVGAKTFEEIRTQKYPIYTQGRI